MTDANANEDTTVQFQMINSAYETLSDPMERRKYDVRMNYYDTTTPHFIISDLEDYSIKQDQQFQQQEQFGNLSNDRQGGKWQVRPDGRMFLMDNENDGTPHFRTY